MSYAKHCTLYGDALAGVDTAPGSEAHALLSKYDTLIVSPGVYSRLHESLLPKTAPYFCFFAWARYSADDLDWQPGPGDLGMPEVVKEKGGRSWIYTVDWRWARIFCKALLMFGLSHEGKFQRIFLDDWMISHSWWGIPNWGAYSQPGELRAIMLYVEQFADLVSKEFGSADPLANGEPLDFQWPDLRWYAESFGSSWNPALQVLIREHPGMFVQVNSDDLDTRKGAAHLAKLTGGSLGCQPDEGVLSYDDIEDPDDWPPA